EDFSPAGPDNSDPLPSSQGRPERAAELIAEKLAGAILRSFAVEPAQPAAPPGRPAGFTPLTNGCYCRSAVFAACGCFWPRASVSATSAHSSPQAPRSSGGSLPRASGPRTSSALGANEVASARRRGTSESALRPPLSHSPSLSGDRTTKVAAR